VSRVGRAGWFPTWSIVARILVLALIRTHLDGRSRGTELFGLWSVTSPVLAGPFEGQLPAGHLTMAAGGETAADPTLFAGITGELCLTGPPIDAGPGTGLCFGGPPTELCAEAVLRAVFPRKYIVTTRISGACFIAASYHETLKRRKVSPAYRQAPTMAPVAAGRLPARLATGAIARSDKGPVQTTTKKSEQS
jgi:hypothetical protein